MDVANIWGVDYDSSIDDGNKIRSSVGFGVDWFTPIGPLNFSLAAPISKACRNWDIFFTCVVNVLRLRSLWGGLGNYLKKYTALAMSKSLREKKTSRSELQSTQRGW